MTNYVPPRIARAQERYGRIVTVGDAVWTTLVLGLK